MDAVIKKGEERVSEKSKIAYGVSRESSWSVPFSADYQVHCGCGSKRHDISVEFEYEADGHTVTMSFYKEVSWCCYWQTKGWWGTLIKRISGALTMLFKGRIDLEETFMLFGVEHIDSFIDALQEGKSRLLTYCEGIKEKKDD